MSIGVEPEVLSRDDVEHGRWTTKVVPNKRGLPMTNPVEREMRAPDGDDASARATRAHEMMHAKVSPAHEMQDWIDRGIASHESLTVCEELRVNLLCSKAGFDMDALSDDGETADGERAAITGDWASTVRFAIAVAGTGSAKKYLNGVRRHNRVWGKALLDIQKRAVKEMTKAWKTGTLASTEVHPDTGLSPLGFRHVEMMAEWLDRICGMTPPEEDETTDDKAEKGEDDGDSSGKGVKAHVSVSTEKPKKLGDFKDELKGVKPYESMSHGDIPRWGTLEWEHIPLDATSTGSMSKKRTPTNVGRNPRRMHRYMTDPQRRVFDKTTRGKGGIVVVDVSGSMSWNMEQVQTIVENASGATVMAYSWSREGGPNAWILAKNGKMARDISSVTTAGNGVDFPALQWAVENRRRHEPIVWVTDGGVTGVGDGWHSVLAKQCREFADKHGIVIVSTMEHAVKAFKQMAKGKKPEASIPSMLWPSAFRAD